MDLNVFFVQGAIVHQIPQARLTEKVKLQPMLADVPIDLDDRRKTYFQRRIRRSLQNGFEAEYDPGSGSPVPARVVEFFADVSHDIARHLHASQGGSSPSGLMAVIEGTIGTGKTAGKCIAVLKLEMEEGVHFELVEKNGVKTFEMQVEEVTLTDTTRVFKASLFTRADIIADLAGVVSDDQLDSSTAGREIADYFLHRFLGCRIKQTPNIATKRYLEVLAALVGAYSEDELEHFSTLISAFVKERRSVIAALYEANRNNEDVHPLLFQPEAIAILERLENAAARLRASWDTVMPSRLLDSLSEALHRPV